MLNLWFAEPTHPALILLSRQACRHWRMLPPPLCGSAMPGVVALVGLVPPHDSQRALNTAEEAD